MNKPTPDNFVAFFTVCGFFIGMIFSIVSIQGAFEIIAFTVFITFIFYILIHIAIMSFVDTKKVGIKGFDKDEFEMTADILVRETEAREKRMKSTIKKLEDEKKELEEFVKLEAATKKRKKVAKKLPNDDRKIA